jgi:hypothetical protein
MEIDARHIGERHVCRGFLADFLLATGSLLAKLCLSGG